MRHPRDVFDAEFSFDGRLIVTASADCTARIWDASTGEAISPPLIHRYPVKRAVLAPHNYRFGTAGAGMVLGSSIVESESQDAFLERRDSVDGYRAGLCCGVFPRIRGQYKKLGPKRIN